ncbi:MAG: alkaline phosphatase family protein [Armatimonadota bacterium]
MSNKRKKSWWFSLVFLVLLATAAISGYLIGRLLGTILMTMLVITLLISFALISLLYKIRILPHRRLFRILRGSAAFLIIITSIAIISEGGISIFRFTGDRASLPISDRYVVLIIADGASLIQARDLVMSGLDDKSAYDKTVSRTFPNISKYFLDNGAFTANGISVWPSSSIPAHTGIMTGAYPRHTGVMGQRQFSSENRHYTSYIGLGIMNHRNILSPAIKTLYEYFPHVRSLDVLQVVNRGCSLFVPGPPEDEMVVGRACQIVDATSTLNRFSGNSEIPRILVMTLPGIDHQTHNSSFNSEKALKAYLDIDRYMGEIADLYKRKGIFDKTLFIMAADHGMGEVTNHVTIDNLMHDMRFTTYESFKWTAVPAWGSFEANFWVGTRKKLDNVYNCLPLWGGNSDALLYIKGQELVDGVISKESWSIRNTDEQLENYMVGGTQINVIRRLLDYSPGIGLIFTNPSKDVFHVYSKNGTAEIQERRQNGQIEFRYKILDRADPLGYNLNPAIKQYIDKAAWLNDQQWIRLTYLEHYPDAIRRITYSMQHPNSGTLHIVAADGWDFAPYYIAKDVLVGSHGSLNQQQSLVPIMFYGPGVRHVELPYARTVDILPTILAYLGIQPTNIDGRPLPIFINDQKNQELSKSSVFPIGSPVSDEKCEYHLRNIYASYDQQIVSRDKTTGKLSILVPSTREALPVLRRSINSSLECTGIQGDNLLFKVIYLGEKRTGPTLRVKVNE